MIYRFNSQFPKSQGFILLSVKLIESNTVHTPSYYDEIFYFLN